MKKKYKQNIYVLVYMYIRWRNFFYSVKLEKESKKNKILNLFGYEEKKIIF